MDENVRKAPSLLDELEGVVRDIEVAESWDCTGDQMRCLDGSGCECAVRGCDRPDVEGDAVNFIRTHHAEIAEALKDARRYREARDGDPDSGCPYIARERQDSWGNWKTEWLGGLEADRAIDAMHNNAREGGE